MKTRTLSIMAAGLLAGPMAANAGLITSSAPLGAATVINFSQFDIGNFTFTRGPTNLGQGVTWSADAPSDVDPGFGGGTSSLGNNGMWTDPPGPGGRDGYSFMNNPGTSMTYRFGSPVQGVGGFINYCPLFCEPIPAMIQALGPGDVVLESYDLEVDAPISTPGVANAGAFRGILRTTNDIEAFRVLNRAAVLDDLTFTRNAVAVPEPATLLLTILGLAGLGWSRRRRAS